jgi:hypothetical protein
MESEDLDSQLYCLLQASLKLSSPDQLVLSVSTLLKLLQNILTQPAELKFRTIKRSNKVIQTRLLSVPNMSDVLALIGFRPVDADVLQIDCIDSLDIAAAILQSFESELRESMKTEEEKETERRQMEIRKQARAKEDAKKKVLEQAALDRKETGVSLMPTQDSHAVHRGPGQARTFKDIGVDLNAVKKG